LTAIALGTALANMRRGPMLRVPNASNVRPTRSLRAAAEKSIRSAALKGRPPA
jgi:hypothetical protein